MQAELLIVQVAEMLGTGNALYRYHAPSRELSRIPGVVVIECDPYHRFLPWLLGAAHVVVFQGFDTDYLPLIDRRRRGGKATIFEVSDDYLDIQPFNPRSAQWVDRAVVGDLRHFMEGVDAVQFSSTGLRDRYGGRCRRTAVFPNQLWDVPRRKPRTDRPLTVGWGGSASHLADWLHITPVLQRWLDARPDVHIAVMTEEIALGFLRLPPERYHFTPPGSLHHYLDFLDTLDIGLAPLMPTDFNRGRTDLKFLEYAAHGVPGIYADFGPYRETVAPGVNGLLYRNEEEFIRSLDRLAGDDGEREAIAAAAWDYVSNNRRLRDHVGQRLDLYRGLLGPALAPTELPDQVVEAATADGCYFRLDRGPPERALLAALAAPDVGERVRRIGEVVDQHPDYLSALCFLGQQLNEARTFGQALHHLETALAIEPRSARTLLEIGRARSGLGDRPAARNYIDAAIQINPCFQASWRHLYHILAASSPGADAKLVEEGLARFPGDYALALTAVRALPTDEVVARIARLVEQIAPTVEPYERTAAVTAFSATIAEVVAHRLDDPVVLDLLERASSAFPESAKLHDLLGHSLRQNGNDPSSREHFRRAIDLRRAAAVYRAEYPSEGTAQQVWLVGEYTARWTG